MAAPEAHEPYACRLKSEATGAEHDAQVVPATRDHFVVHRDVWRQRLRQLGALDAEWDWLADFEETERPLAKWESYALIDVTGRVHALMSIEYRSGYVYVDRLAVAPWNRKESGSRELKGCGLVLLIHAMRRSMGIGFRGQVALHSLEDDETVRFYRDVVKMVETRKDPADGHELRYFELPIASATAWLAGRRP